MAWRARAASAGSSPSGSRPASLRRMSQAWTSAASGPSTAAGGTPARGRLTGTRATTTSSIPARYGPLAGRCVPHRRTRACRSSAPGSRRSQAGSARTGLRQTTIMGQRRRPAGPDSSGRRRSGPSVWRPAIAPACSIRPRSASCCCGAPTPWSRSNASAPTGSTGPWAPSSTRRSSTGTGGSRLT